MMTADVDMGNKKSGTALLQMMMYAIIQRKPEQIQPDVVKFFIDSGAVLSRVLTYKGFNNVSVLEMSISLTCFDIALKLIFEHHVDPIYGGDPVMKPIFVEYGQFGTNHFIKLVLKKYDQKGKIPDFIECLLDPAVFSEELRHSITEVFGRNAYHTFLLSGHGKAIDCLIEKKQGVLEELDFVGRTALHVAAEQGDIRSVEILLRQ